MLRRKIGRKTAREVAPLRKRGADKRWNTQQIGTTPGTFARGCWVIRPDCQKSNSSRENSRLKALFRLDPVNRVLMFKTMGVSAAQLKRWIDDTTNGLRVIY